MPLPITIPQDQLEAFCKKWKITEFALFGSVLRDDFGPDSDVDVMVVFAPDAHPTLITIHHVVQELEMLVARKVDLVTRLAIERSSRDSRRKRILSTAQVLYAA